MPFKMEFLNGNKMFVDVLSRPPSLTCAVDLGLGPPFSTSLDEQVIRTAQQKDKEFAKLFLLHKQVAPLGATTYQGLPTHLYNNLLCTFTRQGKRVLLALPNCKNYFFIWLTINRAINPMRILWIA